MISISTNSGRHALSTLNSLDAQLILPLDAKFYRRPANSTARRQLNNLFLSGDWLKNSPRTKLNRFTKCLGDQSYYFKIPRRPITPTREGESQQQQKLGKDCERRQHSALKKLTGWIYPNDFLEHHLIQIMLVGIELIDCVLR